MVNDGPNDLTLSAQKSDAIVDEENSFNLLSQKMRHSDKKMRHSHQVALVDGGGCRKHATATIKWKRVEALALRKRKQGIDYRDILKLADNPKFTVKQAQKVLRNYKDRGKLHACKRRNPQKYYPTDADAKLAALESDKNSKKMRHSDPTGGTPRRQDKNVTNPSTLTVPNAIAAYRSAPILKAARLSLTLTGLSISKPIGYTTVS